MLSNKKLVVILLVVILVIAYGIINYTQSQGYYMRYAGDGEYFEAEYLIWEDVCDSTDEKLIRDGLTLKYKYNIEEVDGMEIGYKMNLKNYEVALGSMSGNLFASGEAYNILDKFPLGTSSTYFNNFPFTLVANDSVFKLVIEWDGNIEEIELTYK